MSRPARVQTADHRAKLRAAERKVEHTERARTTALSHRLQAVVAALRDGWTQEAIADAMGVSRQRVQQWSAQAVQAGLVERTPGWK